MRENHLVSIDLNQIFIITGIIAGVVGIVLGLVKLHYMREDRKPRFTYEKLLNGEVWQLMILHPNKHINKIYVTIDGKRLRIFDTKDRYERAMREGEGETFEIGKDAKDDTMIVINFDGHKIKKKFKDISLYKHSGL